MFPAHFCNSPCSPSFHVLKLDWFDLVAGRNSGSCILRHTPSSHCVVLIGREFFLCTSVGRSLRIFFYTWCSYEFIESYLVYLRRTFPPKVSFRFLFFFRWRTSVARSRRTFLRSTSVLLCFPGDLIGPVVSTGRGSVEYWWY